MRRKVFISLAAVALLGSTLGGLLGIVEAEETVSEAWVAHYDGPGTVDEAYAIAVDGLGNVYVTGWSNQPGSNDGDYATVKYDSDGNQVWAARYDGPVGYYRKGANAIAVDGSGNVYVTGGNYGSGIHHDYATVKYDGVTGNELWVARYDGPANHYDVAYAIAVDGSGNIYVTGTSYSVAANYRGDYATIKYDSETGDELWVARYDGTASQHDEARGITLDGSGNVYVTGQSDGDGGTFTFEDYVTIKYDGATGNQLWLARYDGPASGEDEAYDITLDGLGGVYITGGSSSDDQADYATVKYDSETGDEVWVARYAGLQGYWEEAYAIAVDGLGDVYVTGAACTEVGPPDTHPAYATIKYDGQTGNELWVARYFPVIWGHNVARDIAVDVWGNVYVTGESLRTSRYLDYVTIKYDGATGNQLWLARYDCSTLQYNAAYAIAVDGSGNIYVTGTIASIVTSWDYVTIKYEQPSCAEVIAPTGIVRFRASSGTIENLTAVPEDQLPGEGKPDLKFPHGFFSFDITGLTEGETVTVTVQFPANIPKSAQYWKYDPTSKYHQIKFGSNDGDNVLTIELTDGGKGDGDGAANGQISDPGGPGIPPAPPAPEGCFIATAAYGTSTAAELDTLRAFRDEVLLQSTLGSELVSLYYEISPPLADFISEHEALRTLVRELLVDPVVWVVEATESFWRD